MLGNILGSVASSMLSSTGSNHGIAMQLVQALMQSDGGIQGLIAKFQNSGLDDILKSWISSEEENAPISASQVTEVLGQETLQSAAQSVGVESQEASDILADFLPKLVDKLTPNGELPDLQNFNASDMMAQVAKGMLGKLFS